MKKQDIMHFFDEHKTELICLGVGNDDSIMWWIEKL